MKPAQIAAAVIALALAALLVRNRRRWPGERRAIAAVVVIALGVYASGVLSGLPSFEHIIKDLAKALGKWTYLLVGVMAFLETGAFVGFIAPGEFTVILGGVIAAQGTISILPLIGIVWICAIAGDSVSFLIGRRVGREFLLRHGGRVGITPERFGQVEKYFDRHGGKTIVIGRFLGFVRPLAPFIAGTSRMSYRRFLAYSVVGTGLWGSTFCLLGFIFWESFSTVSKVAGRVTFALGVIAAIVVAVVYLRRRLSNPGERRRLEAWLEGHPVAGRAWRLAGRPIARVAWPRIRGVWGRLTPGNLGIELTTCVAVAAAGFYVFALFGSMLGGNRYRELPGDGPAFSLAADLYDGSLIRVAKVVTAVGAFPTVLGAVVVALVVLVARRRSLELLVLAGGFALVVLATHLAKAGFDRPRPPGGFISTITAAYPSGHSANAGSYVVLGVIAARVLRQPASRLAAVSAGIALALTVAATRVYLRAHYLSDVLGGLALSLAIYATLGAVALVVGRIRQNGRQRSPA